MTFEEKTHMSIDTLEYEITHSIRHVTLRCPLKRKCTPQLTFIFVFENLT